MNKGLFFALLALLIAARGPSLVAQDSHDDSSANFWSQSGGDLPVADYGQETPERSRAEFGSFNETDDSAHDGDDCDDDACVDDQYCVACLGDSGFEDEQVYLEAIEDISIIEADYLNSLGMDEDATAINAAVDYIRAYEDYYDVPEDDRWSPEDLDLYSRTANIKEEDPDEPY